VIKVAEQLPGHPAAAAIAAAGAVLAECGEQAVAEREARMRAVEWWLVTTPVRALLRETGTGAADPAVDQFPLLRDFSSDLREVAQRWAARLNL
jgi:predicted trehalose synthase